MNKLEFTSGTPEAITTALSAIDDLVNNGVYLFWRQGATIQRLSVDAPVMEADLGVQALEVTQGMQTLNNVIRLVQDKLFVSPLFSFPMIYIRKV